MTTQHTPTNATHGTVSDVPPMYLDGFGHWLAGFADGEGCFLVQLIRNKAGKRNYLPKFVITLREDDRAILEEVAERTGLGTVRHYHSPSMRAVGKPGRVHWTVASKSECATLVRIFDAYPLRAKKARDFAIWRQAVQEMFKPGKRDWNRLLELKTQLEDVRAFDGEFAPILELVEDPTLFDAPCPRCGSTLDDDVACICGRLNDK